MASRFSILRGAWILALLTGASIQPALADHLALTFSASTLTFSSGSPSAQPSVAAAENPISITVQSSGNWVMTVVATDDLLSGSDRIPINRLTWTASGAGFQGGTMSKASQQLVGSGNAGPMTGSLSFFLSNSWSDVVGSYTTLLNYVVVQP